MSVQRCVHLFGNTCSPALAHAGIKYATSHPEANKYPEAVRLLTENMYVDDLLAGCRNIEDAIELLENIREILSKLNIRFCKIISNAPEVMNHFPQSELECLNKEVNLGDSVVHRTLGVAWNVEEDYLFIKSELPSKPFTIGAVYYLLPIAFTTR